MDSVTFLDKAAKAKPQPIYVLPGDEAFLKRRVLEALRALVLAVQARADSYDRRPLLDGH